MRRSLHALLVVLLVSIVLSAQVRQSAVSGTITDASGAVLPGVTISLHSAALVERERSVVSDQHGQYRIVDLPAGRYQVSATLPGFTSVQTELTLAENEHKVVSLALRIGSLEEAITVSSGTPRVHQQERRRRAAIRPRPRLNTETYDKIDEYRWATTRHSPLSTFSSDVDTASYANVRRFLNDGQLPPADAVRTEELINYFTYDYAEPQPGEPFSITTALDDCPWNPEHKLALIGLQTKRISLANTPPKNLVFLIDVSGSMSDANKLPLVQQSLSLLARQLEPRDRIALVVYAGSSGVVLPSTPVEDPGVVVEAIDRLRAGGSTNGAGGITLAYQIARDHFIAGGINRVVLATDGDFNVGVTNQGDLVRLIEKNREQGVTLSVLGFGMGNYKDSTLEKLADRGNGNYAYIDTLNEARKVLVEQAAGTLMTVAKDVKLQVEFNPALVTEYRLIGYENRALNDRDFNDDGKDAGDMGAGHSVTALYEIKLAGRGPSRAEVDPLKYQTARSLAPAASSQELMTVKARYKAPQGRRSVLMVRPVSASTPASPELGFAAAVAQFAMLLRESEFKGQATFASTRELAKRYQGVDPEGRRAELHELVTIAERMSAGRSAR